MCSKLRSLDKEVYAFFPSFSIKRKNANINIMFHLVHLHVRDIRTHDNIMNSRRDICIYV